MAVLAAGLAVVAAVHLVPVRQAMERHLERESVDALAAEGLPGVDVDVTGLEARLTGSVPAPSDVERALRAVVSVDAVASAEALLDVGSGATGGDQPAPPPPDAAPPEQESPTGQAVVEDAASADATEAAARAADALAAVPRITFLQNSVVLTTEGEEAVALIAGVIAAAPPGLRFRVEAHSDLAGPDDFNQQLSVRRAATVRSALIGLGVPRTRVVAVGLGETAPLVVPEVTEEDRLTNRRIEIVPEIVTETVAEIVTGTVDETAS
jgi:outer membrane protein OmpA-like peptidoglycan-associated protein